MDDMELIEKLIDGTHTRIREITQAFWKQADEEAERQMQALGETPRPISDEDAEATVRWIWKAPLSEMAVHLLRMIAAKSLAGEFVADEASVASVCVAIRDATLIRATGIHEPVRIVLEKMGEALIEVLRTYGPVAVSIDRRPYRLRAMDA